MQNVSLSSLKIFQFVHDLQQKFPFLLRKFFPFFSFSPISFGENEKIVIWREKPLSLPAPRLEGERDKRITPYAFKELLKKDLFTGKIFAFQIVKGRWYCRECFSPLVIRKISHPVRGYKSEHKACIKVIRTVADCTQGCKRLKNLQGTPITFDGIPVEDQKKVLDEIIVLSSVYARRINT